MGRGGQRVADSPRNGTTDPCGGHRIRDDRGRSMPPSLRLENREGVAAGVDDPRNPREPDVGDAVLCLQLGEVVLLDLDAACAELLELGAEVDDPQPAWVCVSAVPVMLRFTLSVVGPQ